MAPEDTDRGLTPRSGLTRRELLRQAPALGAGVVLLSSWADLAGPAAGPAAADDTVRTFHADWSTPSGTPLGGFVDLEVHANGDYVVNFHAHSSSIFGDFDFALRAYLGVPGGPVFFFHHAGHVSQVDSADYPESGNSPLIALHWGMFDSNAPFTVVKDYQWGGVVGVAQGVWQDIQGLVSDIVSLTASVVGYTVGAVIGVTREAIGWIGANPGPGGTVAVLAGFVVFVTAGSIIMATVAGVAAGLVTDALIATRPMSAAEIAQARVVFCDRIPYDKITLTNFHTINNRAFTAPGVDGRTYVNLGPAYDNPIGYTKNGSYPAPGQLLIHELTHAWQIEHTGFLPGMVCSGIILQTDNSVFGDHVYEYGPAGRPWSGPNGFGLEQQGAIVDQWFAGNMDSGSLQGQSSYQPMDWRNPYAHYIRHDIRFLGQDG
jgi:hypothetical protein